MTIPTPEEDRFAHLRDLRPELRSDLQISRQITRGEPVYVVYDPVNFKAHRLSNSDYLVVCRLRGRDTLQQTFDTLVAESLLEQSTETEFFSFLAQLDALNLLSTSTQSSAQLFKRFEALADAERKAKWKSWMFLTLPIANPDKFLDRTVRTFSFLFTPGTVLLWAVAFVVALGLVVTKWQEFVLPINSLLATQNIVFMSLAFLGLKVWHELGHGYACKHFGGRVPEMGCKLIVGMPLAYVDATSAWSFPRKRHRIIVMLGGMYFESLIAIPAAIVWAFNPDSVLGSFAYQLIFMAGVAAIFFNANPLMRYDGYFILSDIIGIPNLRARATAAMHGVFKRRVLGLPTPIIGRGWERPFLISYGIASALYMTSVMLSISVLIALRFQALGLLLATGQLLSLCVKNGQKFFTYLLNSTETETVRARARIVAGLTAVGIPLVLFLVPIPVGVALPAVVSAEQVSVVRVNTPGVVQSIDSVQGDFVRSLQPLLRLENVDADAEALETSLVAQSTRKAAYFVSRTDRVAGTKMHQTAQQEARNAQVALENQANLVVRAPNPGRLVSVLSPEQQGTFLARGTPVATITSGKTIVRAWVDEDQLRSARLVAGARVRVRLAEKTSETLVGTVLSVSPSATTEFQDLALTTLGQGLITVDPETGESTKPLFQVRIELPQIDSRSKLHDARAYVLANRNYQSVAGWCFYSTQRFVNSIFLN